MTVEIGTAIVSYIEPEAGYASEFNAWYERDHFLATVRGGPGVFAGARFVATGECKKRRPPSGTMFGDPARGSYLSIAWVLAGKQNEWDAWVAREMASVSKFAHREHMHTAVYRLTFWTPYPAPLFALDGGATGVIALATTNVESVPALDPADAPIVVGMDLARTVLSTSEPPPHTLVLDFCARDPLEVFARYDVPPDAGFASPFVATIPGTDTYTEDL